MSPMNRATKTAMISCENHPNYENIIFKAIPDMRESILSVSDLGINIY
jgi:hypothetical protein